MPPRTQPLLAKDVLQHLYFEEGLSFGAIAATCGTNVRLVRDSFVAHGLIWRSRSEAATGKVKSSETRARMSAARKGVRLAPELAARHRAFLRTICSWSKGLTAETDPRVARQAAAAAAAMRTPEYRQRRSEITARLVASGTHYERGYHVSTKAGTVYYMSSWEADRWVEFDDDSTVLTYRRPGIWIPYEWEGLTKNYVPDVLVFYVDGTVVLEEIKPRHFAENDPKTRAKLLAGAAYAASRGWVFRTHLREK